MMVGVLPSSNIFPMMPSNFPSLVTTGVGLNKISISFFLVMKRRKEICCNACEMGLRPIDPVGVHSRRGFRSRVWPHDFYHGRRKGGVMLISLVRPPRENWISMRGGINKHKRSNDSQACGGMSIFPVRGWLMLTRKEDCWDCLNPFAADCRPLIDATLYDQVSWERRIVEIAWILSWLIADHIGVTKWVWRMADCQNVFWLIAWRLIADRLVGGFMMIGWLPSCNSSWELLRQNGDDRTSVWKARVDTTINCNAMWFWKE